MSEIKENFFENNALFKFKTYSCDMSVDTIHITPGEEPICEYKFIANTSKPVTLAYAPKKGLVRIDEKGSIIESDILGTFVSLCDKKEKDLIKFVNENGFIFPINDDSYEGIKKEDLTNIITRLRYTVELMSEISSTKKDYYKIVSNIISLLFFTPIKIKTNQMQEIYSTHHYQYVDLLRATGGELSEKRKQQEFDTDTFTIENDTIFPNYEIRIDNYNDEISNSLDIYKNILQVYVNTEFEDIEKRKLTDVLFHSLEKSKSLNKFFANKNILDNISDEFKTAIIEVATYIIGEEINGNLNRIHPLYNTKKMTPTWVIDDLLSALYFSIFYLKPNLELYRQCANPRCNKYFLVSATSNKKIYCSPECCSRVTQYTYRKKKKENENKKKAV